MKENDWRLEVGALEADRFLFALHDVFMGLC